MPRESSVNSDRKKSRAWIPERKWNEDHPGTIDSESPLTQIDNVTASISHGADKYFLRRMRWGKVTWVNKMKVLLPTYQLYKFSGVPFSLFLVHMTLPIWRGEGPWGEEKFCIRTKLRGDEIRPVVDSVRDIRDDEENIRKVHGEMVQVRRSLNRDGMVSILRFL